MPAKKAKKAGRPKLPKGEALGKPVQVRLLDDERKRYERVAEKAGLTLSEWIRKTLNESMK